MSRRTPREGLDKQDLRQFAGGHEILINPTEEDICKALAGVQRRCRKYLLSSEEALEVYRQVALDGASAAHAGLRDCPARFDFGISMTVVQAARLAQDLVGCSIGRILVLPGQAATPPIWADPVEDPGLWFNQVVTSFWTHLTDIQITSLRQYAVTNAMELAARIQWSQGSEDGARRAGARRRLQLQALFKRTEPVYMPELSLALRRIAQTLEENGQESVDWRTFQRQWPSIAARYKRDLLGVFRGGHAQTSNLAVASGDTSRYFLNFTTWSGAQRVVRATQIVFQICSRGLLAGVLSGSAAKDALCQDLRRLGQNSFHPVTPETVGWLRVHVDDANRLCFVDEVQSDVMEYLLSLGGEDAEGTELVREFADWQTHGFSTVQHWAQCIGYRVAVHSQESAGFIEGKTASDRKWNVYYRALIKRFGLIEAQIGGYPAAIFVQV